MQASVIFLMGPTASGKTDIALQLAETLPVEIVSVDSALVYREMNIGTSKPSPAILKQIPHHLIDICDPAENYSAARFRNDALALIADILQRGKLPLLVGGTMLYFRALEYGLSDMPEADAALRHRLDAQLTENGLPSLYATLRQVDPVAAGRINENDPQRILRALEVYYLTGKPISHWWASANREPLPYQTHKIALVPEDRSLLHARIERRFDRMLDEGFLREVESLFRRDDLHDDLPSIRSVGYRQVWHYLQGKIGFDEMRMSAIAATRQLAKRQLTWLRREQNLIEYNSESSDTPRAIKIAVTELLT